PRNSRPSPTPSCSWSSTNGRSPKKVGIRSRATTVSQYLDEPPGTLLVCPCIRALICAFDLPAFQALDIREVPPAHLRSGEPPGPGAVLPALFFGRTFAPRPAHELARPPYELARLGATRGAKMRHSPECRTPQRSKRRQRPSLRRWLAL